MGGRGGGGGGEGEGRGRERGREERNDGVRRKTSEGSPCAAHSCRVDDGRGSQYCPPEGSRGPETAHPTGPAPLDGVAESALRRVWCEE